MMNLQERLAKYNAYFGFKEKPEAFSFEISPEREVYKNEALRKHDRNLYATYLAENYAVEMQLELQDFDLKLATLQQVTLEELKLIMLEKKANLLISDIDFHDQDAIFTFLKVNDEYIPWHIEDNEDDLMNTTVTIEQAFGGKEFIYIIK